MRDLRRGPRAGRRQRRADSVALAVALAFEAPRAGLRAGGVTVDHRLQPGSAARAAQVADDLRALGLDPVEATAVDVGPAADGPEAAARQARYAGAGRGRRPAGRRDGPARPHP